MGILVLQHTQEPSSPAVILPVAVPDFNSYRDQPEQILDRPHACPGCGRRPLTRHDRRLRWVYTPSERVRIVVYRGWCAPCGEAVTLLPDLLLPRFRYLASLIHEAVRYVTWQPGGPPLSSRTGRCTTAWMKPDGPRSGHLPASP